MLKRQSNTESFSEGLDKVGCLAVDFKGCASPFYLTTAIAYTNGKPHMGHAYEYISSDVLVRYYRLFGRKTFFLTGTDEHGQKVDCPPI